MAIEIERKFLVNKNFPRENGVTIKQGYLINTKSKVVRVRMVNGIDAYLTIKIAKDDISKEEYEYSIPCNDAMDLFKHCQSFIDKTRYTYGRWEIDEFHNIDLILAEIELDDASEVVDLPSFIISEVTGDSKYYNNNLAINKENND